MSEVRVKTINQNKMIMTMRMNSLIKMVHDFLKYSKTKPQDNIGSPLIQFPMFINLGNFPKIWKW